MLLSIKRTIAFYFEQGTLPVLARFTAHQLHYCMNLIFFFMFYLRQAFIFSIAK